MKQVMEIMKENINILDVKSDNLILCKYFLLVRVTIFCYYRLENRSII